MDTLFCKYNFRNVYIFLFICNSVVFNAACSTFYEHERAAVADNANVGEVA